MMKSKKILLCADSRILFPQYPGEALENFTGINRPNVEYGIDWSSKLYQITNGIHEFTTHRTGIEHYLFTLFHLNDILQNYSDKYFDLTILQLGWIEGILYHEPKAIKEILGLHFKKGCLINPGINNENNFVEFLYYDPIGEKKVFDLINKKSKHCLSVGFHSIKTWCGLCNKRIKPFIDHHYDALDMNQRYSKNSDYLHMPMDPYWNERFIGPDRLHYNRHDGSAADFIAPYIARYIERMNKTINSILLNSKSDFFYQALKVGNNIAHQTNEREVVLLALSNKDQLPLMFIGCILFNRIPLIIQHPSNKISQNKFEQKLRYIIKSTNAKLCICDAQHNNNYNLLKTLNYPIPHFSTKIEISIPNTNDVAFYQLSSGTTNLPKILKISHKHIIAHCDEYANFIGFTKEDVVCSWLPLYHDMGLIAGFLLPLLTQAKFVHINTFN